MPLHYFFSDELGNSSEILTLSPEESRHAVKVLRLNPGDHIMILNGKGLTAQAVLESMDKRGTQLSCRIEKLTESPPRQPYIRLYIAPPKGKNMDTAVKMATELGVTRITPVICGFAVSKPDTEKSAWKQTAVTACKQSHNPWLPLIDAPIPFTEAVANAKELPFLGAVPDSAAEIPLPGNLPSSGVGLWIGPEGGFTDEETQELMRKQAFPLTLGPCILRVETAVPALLGAIWSMLRMN